MWGCVSLGCVAGKGASAQVLSCFPGAGVAAVYAKAWRCECSCSLKKEGALQGGWSLELRGEWEEGRQVTGGGQDKSPPHPAPWGFAWHRAWHSPASIKKSSQLVSTLAAH